MPEVLYNIRNCMFLVVYLGRAYWMLLWQHLEKGIGSAFLSYGFDRVLAQPLHRVSWLPFTGCTGWEQACTGAQLIQASAEALASTAHLCHACRP